MVMLKVLDSGLLMITGPFSLNRVPLRRVPGKFVIATSTKIDLSLSDLHLDKYNDKYFEHTKDSKAKKNRERRSRMKIGGGENDESIFMEETQKAGNEVPQERKNDQQAVDKAVVQCISKHKENKFLTIYMKSNFCLQFGQYPHLMKF